MGAVPVSDGIWWAGGIDWNLRDFHGFETPRGTSYNGYVVKGRDKVALVDTVKTPFVDEQLYRISTIVPLDQVDYIVVNHVEPDHNSGLRKTMEAMPQAKVVATKMGVAGSHAYHGDDLAIDVVGADDVIDLGGKTLHFLPAPMVHWPDSMFTYCPESATLMPNDAFGQHIATSSRFADEIGMDVAIQALGEYWANILSPLVGQIEKALGKIGERGWAPEVIAPSHGVIWRGADQIGTAWQRYTEWDRHYTCPKIVIAYGTMWHSTDMMALAIADGVAEAGAVAKVFDLGVTPVSWATYQLLEAKALLLGSPTLHHGMLHTVSGYLTYLEALKPAAKLAGTFGSYGWGGGAIKDMGERLERVGMEQPLEPLGMKYKPSAEELEACREWGREWGKLVVGSGCELPGER
jgi:anaerobic nitric oxide reductase flavorubredoxin